MLYFLRMNASKHYLWKRKEKRLSRLENQERAAQKAKNDLLEQLKAQEKLEEVSC